MKKPPYFEISLGTLTPIALKVLKKQILRKSTITPAGDKGTIFSLTLNFCRERSRGRFLYDVKIREDNYYYRGKGKDKEYTLVFTKKI